MSYGVNSIQIHKKLRLDKRAGSDNWYARLTLPSGKRLKRELRHSQWLQKNLKHSNQLKVNQSQIRSLEKIIAAQQQHSSAVG